MGLNNFKINLQ